ncbi:MAG: hypothetical protein K2M69_07185 [Muribaculaceae bacterium]|nr:hypothetical protein [Muribaculaceae bacterium]
METTIAALRLEVKQATSQEAAIEILSVYIASHPESDEALTMRGMKYWGAGQRSLAIKDYLAAIRINPDSRAKLALQASQDILNYYNKDLYNP